MKKLLSSLMLAMMAVVATPSHALAINPATGLVDFVFNFSGPGSSATFGGDGNLSITGASPFSITVHVEDCCVDGDSWALVVDGAARAFDVVEVNGADGVANGSAVLSAGSTFWEAIVTLTFAGGTHTIDLTQLTGIAGGSYINVSAARAARVSEPGTLAAVGLGLLAMAAFRRRRQQ